MSSYERDDLTSASEYPLPSDDPEVALIRDWLLSRHVTLWSHFQLLKDGPGRAAVWFLEELESYRKYKEENGRCTDNS